MKIRKLFAAGLTGFIILSSVFTAYKVIKGEKVDKNIFVPFELVAPEDADKYLANYN